MTEVVEQRRKFRVRMRGEDAEIVLRVIREHFQPGKEYSDAEVVKEVNDSHILNHPITKAALRSLRIRNGLVLYHHKRKGPKFRRNRTTTGIDGTTFGEVEEAFQSAIDKLRDYREHQKAKISEII